MNISIKKCEICGKEIRYYSSTHKHRRFCSYKCMGIYQSKIRNGKNSPWWKGGLIKIKCAVCNKEFTCFPSDVKNVKIKCCSKKCMGIWNSKNRIRENSINWKGGITTITTKIRTSKKYSNWRNLIFKRDGYICKKCKKNNSGNLIVHHKKSFHKIIQKIKDKMPLFNLYDTAMSFAELWDINNGVTLCFTCHKKKHFLQK